MTGIKKFILVTTTRADWGILSPLARALASRPDVNLYIAAGNMHLSPRYGLTVNEIEADGFSDIIRLEAPETDSTSSSRTAVCAATMTGMASAIDSIRPDAVIVLGDRYEMLGAATAALIAGVPIVHLHGGEISEGAIDDSIRHAVSKMATLHLTATANSARRLIGMGEEPRRVVHTGAIGVENVLSEPVMSLDELRRSLDGFPIDSSRTLLVTFHPVTRDPDGLDPSCQVDELLGALEDVAEANVILTYPNNDTGGEEIIARLRAFAARNTGRTFLIPSLGKRRYLSALHYVRAVVGNTSSGILEAPSTPASTIDIGARQNGRERAASVIHVPAERHAIARAIRSLPDSPRPGARPDANPYYRPGAVNTAVDAICNILPTLTLTKRFNEL